MKTIKMRWTVRQITLAAVIAAAYIVLTLPMAQFAFGPVQFRLAEALAVLAVITPAAIPGLFLGCLLANTLNPQSLGLIDIFFGSLATLVSAWLTWRLTRSILQKKNAQPEILDQNRQRLKGLERIIVLLPPIVVNAVVVGFYLPFLLPDQSITVGLIAGFMLSILLSQSVVILLIGIPLLLALEKAAPAFLRN